MEDQRTHSRISSVKNFWKAQEVHPSSEPSKRKSSQRSSSPLEQLSETPTKSVDSPPKSIRGNCYPPGFNLPNSAPPGLVFVFYPSVDDGFLKKIVPFNINFRIKDGLCPDTMGPIFHLHHFTIEDKNGATVTPETKMADVPGRVILLRRREGLNHTPSKHASDSNSSPTVHSNSKVFSSSHPQEKQSPQRDSSPMKFLNPARSSHAGEENTNKSEERERDVSPIKLRKNSNQENSVTLPSNTNLKISANSHRSSSRRRLDNVQESESNQQTEGFTKITEVESGSTKIAEISATSSDPPLHKSTGEKERSHHHEGHKDLHKSSMGDSEGEEPSSPSRTRHAPTKRSSHRQKRHSSVRDRSMRELKHKKDEESEALVDNSLLPPATIREQIPKAGRETEDGAHLVQQEKKDTHEKKALERNKSDSMQEEKDKKKIRRMSSGRDKNKGVVDAKERREDGHKVDKKSRPSSTLISTKEDNKPDKEEKEKDPLIEGKGENNDDNNDDNNNDNNEKEGSQVTEFHENLELTFVPPSTKEQEILAPVSDHAEPVFEIVEPPISLTVALPHPIHGGDTDTVHESTVDGSMATSMTKSSNSLISTNAESGSEVTTTETVSSDIAVEVVDAAVTSPATPAKRERRVVTRRPTLRELAVRKAAAAAKTAALSHREETKEPAGGESVGEAKADADKEEKGQLGEGKEEGKEEEKVEAKEESQVGDKEEGKEEIKEEKEEIKEEKEDKQGNEGDVQPLKNPLVNALIAKSRASGQKKIQGTLKVISVKVSNLPTEKNKLPNPYLIIKRDWYSINSTDRQYEVIPNTTDPSWTPKAEEAKLSIESEPSKTISFHIWDRANYKENATSQKNKKEKHVAGPSWMGYVSIPLETFTSKRGRVEVTMPLTCLRKNGDKSARLIGEPGDSGTVPIIEVVTYWTKFGRHDTTVDYRVNTLKGAMQAIEKKKKDQANKVLASISEDTLSTGSASPVSNDVVDDPYKPYQPDNKDLPHNVAVRSKSTKGIDGEIDKDKLKKEREKRKEKRKTIYLFKKAEKEPKKEKTKTPAPVTAVSSGSEKKKEEDARRLKKEKGKQEEEAKKSKKEKKVPQKKKDNGIRLKVPDATPNGDKDSEKPSNSPRRKEEKTSPRGRKEVQKKEKREKEREEKERKEREEKERKEEKERREAEEKQRRTFSRRSLNPSWMKEEKKAKRRSIWDEGGTLRGLAWVGRGFPDFSETPSRGTPEASSMSPEFPKNSARPEVSPEPAKNSVRPEPSPEHTKTSENFVPAPVQDVPLKTTVVNVAGLGALPNLEEEEDSPKPVGRPFPYHRLVGSGGAGDFTMLKASLGERDKVIRNQQKQFASKLKAEKEKRKAAESALKSSKEEAKKLRSVVLKLETSNSAFAEKLTSLEAKISEAQEELKEKKKDREDRDALIEKLNAELLEAHEASEKTTSLLESKIAFYDQETLKATQTLIAEKDISSQAQRELSIAQQLMEQLKKELEESRSREKEQEAQISKLTQKNVKLLTKLEASAEKSLKFSQDLEILNSKNEAQEKELKEVKQQHHALEISLNLNKVENENLEKALQFQKDKEERLRKELDEKEKEEKERKAREQAKEREMEEREARRREREGEPREDTAQREEIENKYLEDIQQLEENLQIFVEKVSIQEKELFTLRESNQALTSCVTGTQAVLSIRDEEVIQLKEELATVKGDYKQTKEREEENNVLLTTLKSRVQDLKSELTTREQKLQDSEKEVLRLSQENKHLNLTVTSLEKHVRYLQEQAKEDKICLESLSLQLKTQSSPEQPRFTEEMYQKSQSALTEAQRRAVQYQADLTSLQHTIDDLKAKEGLREAKWEEERKKVEAERNDLQEKLEQMHKKLNKAKEELDEKNEKEQERKEKLEEANEEIVKLRMELKVYQNCYAPENSSSYESSEKSMDEESECEESEEEEEEDEVDEETSSEEIEEEEEGEGEEGEGEGEETSSSSSEDDYRGVVGGYIDIPKGESIEQYLIMGEEIGIGSFGSVYKGVEKKYRKDVAIKVIKTTSKELSNQEQIEKIKREIDIQSPLKHKHILPIFSLFSAGTTFYLTMPYITGGNLYDLVSENEDGLSEELAKRYTEQILLGLEFLHEVAFVCHRDIKPENILLDARQRNCKICDFGEAAEYTEDNPYLTGYCGTPYYQALEIWQRDKYTNKVDLWATGVLVYVMLTSQQPWDWFFEERFEEDEEFLPSEDELRAAILATVSEGITAHLDNPISPEAEELLCHLLEVNDTKRYSASDALAKSSWLTK
eukprot:TRINITY_DN2283_c0_g1_i1.p1 TRINITY_DN2283_c0_g1~~TRINITY_DN2283_c0_g1_i1.p1  ORF type:complete len:2275 (-),score=723.35 TRINITY_DN2283_c0_g1_i1:162-6986(-)